MVKKIFLIIFLYFVLLCLSVFTIYLCISFSFEEELIGIIPNIKSINNIIILLYIILLLFLFFILRGKEKYIIVSTVLYFIIFFVSISSFYFGYFKKDIFELVDIPDEKFITKYQNLELKDEENIYTYLFNIQNPEYKSNTLFGKYKDKFSRIQNDENYNKELIESVKFYNCYIQNEYLELCNGLSINAYLKNKNYPHILEQTKTFTNILKLVNKNNIYKTNENYLSLNNFGEQLKSNFYYLLVNAENNDNKEIIEYFQDHYDLFGKVLNGDINIVEMIVYTNSLDILNNQLQYILSNYDFSKEEKEALYNFLSKIHNNFNEKEIYSNVFKTEYNIVKSSINKGVIGGVGNLDLASQNFLYNYDKTIKVLKNVYYFSYMNKDLSKSKIIKNTFSEENRLSSIFRYNIFGNIQVINSYIASDLDFEPLEKNKLDIEKIIELLKR